MDHDRETKLLLSHDELMAICKAQMEIILRAGLHKKMDKEFLDLGVEPGFAGRAEESQNNYKMERLRLMASGDIK